MNFLRAPIDFSRTMLALPKPWVVWVMGLMTVNMVIPLFYFNTLEGMLTLAAFALGAVTQTVIHARLGWVRLLGIGHIAWVPLVPWAWNRLALAPEGSLFSYWLMALIALNGLSLIIDGSDVARYILGERKPFLTLAGSPDSGAAHLDKATAR